MNWLDRLQRKMRGFYIPNLMYYISAGMLVVFVAELLFPSLHLSALLALNMHAVRQGQIWRLVSFVFIPSSTSVIWILFGLYFNCMLGNGLEQQWGGFRFNMFYLVGILGSIIAAFFTGYGQNTYLNLSLFLAFAAIYPNYPLLIFFVLPVKMKYLAFIDVALFIWQFIFGAWSTRIAIVFSLLNVILFFGADFLRNLKQQSGYWKTRRNFHKAMRNR